VFNPEEYFARVQEAINRASSYTNCTGRGLRVHLSPSRSWQLIIWENVIEFPTGHQLHVLEIHKREGRSHLRKVKYHLMNGARECVFRVDNHDRPVPFSEPCHIHEGKTKFEDGDPQLRDTSLCEIGFLEIFDWVLRVVEDRPLPWRE
jgi:hypothetical protein